MATVTERIEDAVRSLNESGEVAAQFVDPAKTDDVVGGSGNLKTLAAYGKDADDVVIQLGADVEVLKNAAETEINRIAHFEKTDFVAGVTYEERKIYFVEGVNLYTPVNFPFMASSVIQTDIDSGALTPMQGVTTEDLGRKGLSIPVAKDTAIIFNSLNALLNEDIELGQTVKVKGEGDEFEVVLPDTGEVGNGLHYNLVFGGQVKRIVNNQISTIDDLRFFKPKFHGQAVNLGGYKVAGEGGGILIADFNDTSTPDDNLKTYLTNDNIRMKRPDQLVLTPHMSGVTNADEMQVFLDTVPEGSEVNFTLKTWNLSHGVVVNKKMRLTGSGLLNFTAGITNDAALHINANGCEVAGLHLDNPNELQSQTDGRNYGIKVEANEVLIRNCKTWNFQNSIAVISNGEWHNIQILDSRCIDCIGAGGGRNSSSSLGEDRGDGIVVWGAQAIIRGCIVSAKEGHDCRVGIHAESLPKSGNALSPYPDSLVSITGNIVYGPFRRSIVNEGINGFIASSNLVAGATWWSLVNIEGAKNSVFSNNIVIWTATAEDNQGSNWNVNRGPLMTYGTNHSTSMIGNSVWAAAGSRMSSFARVQGVDIVRQAFDCDLKDNRFYAEDETVTVGNGIMSDNLSDGLNIEGNFLKAKCSRGIYTYGAVNSNVVRNTLDGMDKDWGGKGIESPTSTTIIDNTLRNWYGAIDHFNATTGRVQDNDAFDCNWGLNLFGCLNVEVKGNQFTNIVNSRIRNVGAAMKHLVRDNQGQRLYLEVGFNPLSIAPLGSESENFTITGAAFGDFIELACEESLEGLMQSANVSSADNASLTLFNPTASSVDIPNLRFRLLVTKIGNLA